MLLGAEGKVGIVLFPRLGADVLFTCDGAEVTGAKTLLIWLGADVLFT